MDDSGNVNKQQNKEEVKQQLPVIKLTKELKKKIFIGVGALAGVVVVILIIIAIVNLGKPSKEDYKTAFVKLDSIKNSQITSKSLGLYAVKYSNDGGEKIINNFLNGTLKDFENQNKELDDLKAFKDKDAKLKYDIYKQKAEEYIKLERERLDKIKSYVKKYTFYNNCSPLKIGYIAYAHTEEGAKRNYDKSVKVCKRIIDNPNGYDDAIKELIPKAKNLISKIRDLSGEGSKRDKDNEGSYSTAYSVSKKAENAREEYAKSFEDAHDKFLDDESSQQDLDQQNNVDFNTPLRDLMRYIKIKIVD